MFCSTCGTAADGAATACLNCGVDLHPPAAKRAINADRAVAASKDAGRAIKMLLKDPVGSIGAAHDALPAGKNLDVGITFAVFWVLSCLIAIRMIGRAGARFTGVLLFDIGFKEVMQIALISIVPLIAVVAIMAGLQAGLAKRNELPRALFAGAAALLPLALFNVIGGILGAGNAEVIVIVALFALCYTILLLYAGCRDVLGIPSAAAAALVPLIIIASGWLTKIILAAVL
jgi:hypothetical protein